MRNTHQALLPPCLQVSYMPLARRDARRYRRGPPPPKNEETVHYYIQED